MSVAEIEKNYTLLNTQFDYYYGESDADVAIEETIQMFVDQKLARESEGALVVDVARDIKSTIGYKVNEKYVDYLANSFNDTAEDLLKP